MGDRLVGDRRQCWSVRPTRSGRKLSIVTVGVVRRQTGKVGRSILEDGSVSGSVGESASMMGRHRDPSVSRHRRVGLRVGRYIPTRGLGLDYH